MKLGKQIIITTIAIGIAASVSAQTYQRYGNTVYGSDGSSATRYGNTTYGNNGSSATQYGNTLYRSR